MSRMIIVEGDLTSGGGRVITGSHATDIDGLRVARVNDTCTCPTHKGTFPIVTGDMTFIVDGQPVARHGDKLACGCSLLSTRQFRVFLDGMTSSNAAADAAMFSAAAAATASSLKEADDQELSHVHSDKGHTRPTHPVKAKTVVKDVDGALTDAGTYRVYDTELEAAQAWAAIAEPVANSPEHRVEVGANISEVNGKYVLGTAYSTGSESTCDGLLEKGHKVNGGTSTAYIHTHTVPYAGVGRNRSYILGDDFDRDYSNPHVRPKSGWEIEPGDYDVAYSKRLNAYIAEPGSVLQWNYERFVDLQTQAALSTNTLSDKAVELGAAETRH